MERAARTLTNVFKDTDERPVMFWRSRGQALPTKEDLEPFAQALENEAEREQSEERKTRLKNELIDLEKR